MTPLRHGISSDLAPTYPKDDLDLNLKVKGHFDFTKQLKKKIVLKNSIVNNDNSTQMSERISLFWKNMDVDCSIILGYTHFNSSSDDESGDLHLVWPLARYVIAGSGHSLTAMRRSSNASFLLPSLLQCVSPVCPQR